MKSGLDREAWSHQFWGVLRAMEIVPVIQDIVENGEMRPQDPILRHCSREGGSRGPGMRELGGEWVFLVQS